MNDAQPRKASTVIVIRDPVEVLLMQRSTHDSFMARATVYPGGAVDEADADPLLYSYSGGFDGKAARVKLRNTVLDDAVASGFFFAAIRELFEEAFILLAKRVSGEAVDFSGEPELSRYKGYRKAVHENKMTLMELAKREGLIYTPDALTPFAHWITPVFQKTRFDTWFFLAGLPDGQDAAHDNEELISTAWMTPEDALIKNAAGDIKLMPPTLMTLTELAAFRSANELIKHTSSTHIPAILPEVFAEGSTAGVRLPNDPAYSDNVLRLPPAQGKPSRVILDNGIWRIISSN
jgi:8-oxo-dGTP pyrophosphatase MutT (NUDIX family)